MGIFFHKGVWARQIQFVHGRDGPALSAVGVVFCNAVMLDQGSAVAMIILLWLLYVIGRTCVCVVGSLHNEAINC